MVKFRCMQLGDYQVNCYLVWESGQCVVIDPGDTPEVVLAAARELGLSIQGVLLTHGHFDHVGGAARIVEETGCPLWMHRADASLPSHPAYRRLYPLEVFRLADSIHFYSRGEAVNLAGLVFTVYETPGHTQGSVCLQCGKLLFTGDTLFADACGRTDLPGGDPEAMNRSLLALSRLDPSLRILPGHGPGSTMDQEQRTNPFLKGASL